MAYTAAGTRDDPRATPAAASPARARRAQPRSRWWALAVICTAQLMVLLDGTIVNIALPSAQKELGFSDDERQWIVTAYALAFGSLLLLGGRLADLFGRKTTFIIGIVGFASASAVGGAADGFAMLVVARSIQGLFAALLAPAALSLLTTTFTEAKERARAFGIFGAVGGSGAAVGLTLGGVLTEYLNWRWTLYVNVVIGAVALAGVLVFISRSVPVARPRLDIPGVLLVSSGLFCIVFGFANAPTYTWSDWRTWGFLVAGGVLLLAFFGWQRRAEHPLLPLSVLGDRDRGAAYLTTFIAVAGMFGVFFFLTYYLQGTLGYSPLKNGLAFLPMVGAVMVVAQLSTNWLLPKFGPKAVVPAGLLLAAGGTAGLTRLGLDSAYVPDVLLPLLLLGVGLGLAMPAAISRATLGVPMRDQGVASATVNTAQQIGAAISTALLNTLATSAAAAYVAQHLQDPLVQVDAAVHSYVVTYWWAAGFYAAGAVITVLLFRGNRDNRPATAGDHTAEVILGRTLDGAGAPEADRAVPLIRQAASSEDGPRPPSTTSSRPSHLR
jgi:EmrB/QacA subfamily drug resistance transporter